MADNIGTLKNIMEAVKHPAEGQGNLAEELKEKKASVNAAMKPMPATPAKSPTVNKPSPSDLVNPKAKYGDKSPEQRIDVSDWAKPLGKMHQGGEVPKSGTYLMQKGEHVLTPEKKHMMHHALSLAETALGHSEDKEPEMPKKEIKEMRIRRGASGGHVVIHVNNAPHLHPDEEHVTGSTDGLVDHVMEHMTDPDEGEEEAEMGQHGMDGGKEAIEHAVGYK